ncbi:hypothetical protein JK163_11075 [Levilactobacillus brevis]|uniref:hypothetical protein n=1 Tax=Levilactobacillus brevis TaxID=1580 RepID=UPI001BAABDFE|nr:hypothetical protein [Levilactobacillus brevis]MBS1006810.1 hypothetical protein [Levilactobacillus brevis]
MRSSIAKSIYVGAAVLGLAGLSAVTTTTASAKSYATAGAYTALADKSQNVTVTGTNAIYSKPGTVKGAKVVASKATVAKLAASKKSSDTFYAYGTKTTNRGSVYYKIVTMDKKYRGYVYAGKTATVAGGIKAAETMTKATMPKETTVYFANPGTTNVTWTAPKNTDINAKKNVINTTPFAGDKLTITDAATKTKEGSLYYYVKDATHPSVSGWIYSGAVTSDASVAYNAASDIKINFLATDGTVIKSTTMLNMFENNDTNSAATTTKANAKGTAVGYDAVTRATDSWSAPLLKGTGYTYSADNAANKAALYAAKTGDTVSLTVTKGAQAVQNIAAYYQDGVSNPVKLSDTTPTDAKDLVYQVSYPKVVAAFAGATGATYTAADVQNFLTTNKADTLNSVDYAKDADGNVVATNDAKAIGKDGKTVFSADNPVQVYHTTYTLTSGVAGTYTTNGSVSAFYNTAKEVKGSANTTNTGDVSVFG